MEFDAPMSEQPPDWEEVDALFSAALEQPADRRRAWVRAETPDDSALQRRLFRLLDAAEEDAPFLETRGGSSLHDLWNRWEESKTGSPADPEDDPLIGTDIGPYRIRRLVGRGGMGNVYLGERVGSFQQVVAIKTLRRGIDTDEVVDRFLAERRILAQLQHPNVARLLDGGTTPDGRPYFVMEFVAGDRITEYADAQRLSIRSRLGLFLEVAGAVQHAHGHLVVHRDLKPSNILITHGGVVKLLDFGIARLIGADAHWGTRTSTGMRVLTPAYAAPEQVLRKPTTTATDVYQLGALLFELLTGLRPFSPSLDERELEHHISEVPPTPPSEAVLDRGTGAEASSRGSASSGELSRQIAGDLDLIVGKALRKDPAHRYSSVDAFARDVQRFLEGRPITARKPTVAYRLRRFASRNPWAVPVGVAAVVFMALYLGTLLRHNRALLEERNLAQLEAERANAATEFLETVFSAANPYDPEARSLGLEATVLDALVQAQRRLEVQLDDQPAVQARLLGTIGEAYLSHGYTQEAESALSRSAQLYDRVLGPSAFEARLAKIRHSGAIAELEGVESALSLLDEEIRALESGTLDPSVEARLLRSLGSLEARRSQIDSALSLYRKAVEAYDDLATPDPRWEAVARRSYATALSTSGQYEAAADMGLTSVRLLEDILPPDHLELAASRGQLAGFLSTNNQFDEALELFDQSLEAYAAQVAPDQSDVLSIRNNRALALLRSGQAEAAETEFAAMDPLILSRYGESRRYGELLQNRAVALRTLGRVDDAIAMNRRAHEVLHAALGEHYITAFPLLTIASIALEQEQFGEAERAAHGALELLTGTLGDGHWITQVALCRRGMARLGLGDVEDGRADLMRSARELEGATVATPDYRDECLAAAAAAREG